MAARLKVYGTRIGFHEVIVAAPSQPAALAAWDISDNLFAQGQARVVDDAEAVEQALASPGVVLRRPVGGGLWAAIGASDALPSVPDLPRPKGGVARGKGQPATKTARKPAKKPPDRRPLNRAEAALDKAQAAADTLKADYARRLAALEAEARAASRQADARVRTAAGALKAARRDYRQAGGEP